MNGTCFVPPGAARPVCPFTIGPNNLSSKNEFFPIPFVGMNWKLDEQSALALAFYARGGMNTQWEGGTATFDPQVLITGRPLVPGPTFPGTYGGGFDGDARPLWVQGDFFGDTFAPNAPRAARH